MEDRYMNAYPNDMWDRAVPPGSMGMKLARAYVLNQQYTESYPPEEALERGTMFPELYSPYPARMKPYEKCSSK
jgi:hypothetical protein